MKNKITVEIHQTPRPRRKDSFWFDGHVATVTDGKTIVNIIAQGHIDIYFNPNEKSFSNNEAIKEAISRGYTDKKLKNITKHDGWNNNNWFAFEIVKNGETTIDDYTDVNFDDAIAYSKELLKENNL